MNPNIPTVKTVRVLLLNLDERQFAIFRMAFKMHNTTNYQLIREGDGLEPELVLVDGDVRDGSAQWQAIKQKYVHARVVYFSTQPPAFTAPHLAKPIRFDTLFTNLRNLLQGNGIWMGGMADSVAITPTARLGAAGAGSNTASATHTAVNTAALAAESSRVESKKRQESVSIRSFSTEGTLLGLVMKLLQQDQDTAVTVRGKPVLAIFPSIKRVLLATEPEKIEMLCMQPDLDIETKAVPAGAQLHEKAKIKSEAFVWQLAIWTAQGRLIEPITPDTILKLKSWPNMTRMAFLPESMRLSAFLIKTSVSLSTLYKLLPLNMKDVLNFIAATYATGYLYIEQPPAHRGQQHEINAVLSRDVHEVNIQGNSSVGESAPQPRGLLQRLMNRLRAK